VVEKSTDGIMTLTLGEMFTCKTTAIFCAPPECNLSFAPGAAKGEELNVLRPTVQ
jgi:hypothetical protein